MTLYKLKSAPIVLLEDDINNNTLPLILELVQHEKNTLNLFCLEQSRLWRNVFRDHSNVRYYKEFIPDCLNEYTSAKCSVVVDSVNQMALCLGWSECLKCIKTLHTDLNVAQVILILHKDCISHVSKLQTHLNHIASAIISYDSSDPCKIRVQLKKGGKVVKSNEILSYDNRTSLLKSTPIMKEDKKDVPEKPQPINLSTFKIEVEQTDKLEKYKLKLPYMSKINAGESKVHYEPDAVDDWDEEDPDEDLDI